MPFEKGQEKTGGRQKGSENKASAEAREAFLQTLEGLSDNVQQAFRDVLNGVKDEDGNWVKKPNPDRFLDLFAKYAQFFVPKKTEKDISGEFEFTGIDLKKMFSEPTTDKS